MRAIDLFAGPGGWDEGIVPLGIGPLGIELDEWACATREARGHPTLRADVAALDPLDFAPCELLIGSPPCQAFSAAGKGGGQQDIGHILLVAASLANGKDVRADVADLLTDPRSLLVVEPLRWALALRPRLIALEQVPPVLELWRTFALILNAEGYWTWAGLFSSERYGVPQTRERAFLMASLDGPVSPPLPTHQEYRSGVPAAEQHTLEGVLEPWVSMADALGWGMTERPTVTVVGHSDTGGRAFRLHRGAGMNERHGERPDTPETEPAPTITSKARTARWYDRRQGNTLPGGARRMVPLRPDTEPAPTIAGDGLGKGRDRWIEERPAPTLVTTRRSDKGLLVGRQLAEGEGRNVGGRNWPLEAPATTVAGDPRLTARSHHEEGEQGRAPASREDVEDVEDGTYNGRSAVRVTLEEAAILQGFPADYPWQGSRTAKFTQVGNAVPPPIARAVIAALLAIESSTPIGETVA